MLSSDGNEIGLSEGEVMKWARVEHNGQPVYAIVEGDEFVVVNVHVDCEPTFSGERSASSVGYMLAC